MQPLGLVNAAIANVRHRSLPARFWWAIAAAAALGSVIVGGVFAARSISPWLSSRIRQSLQENFDSRLEIKSLEISLFPSARIVGRGLVLRHKGQTDLPPLATVDQFVAEGSTLAILRKPMRIHRVRIEGLQIHVLAKSAAAGDRPARAHREPPPFILDEVIADGARLETIPKKPGKEPLVWDIQRLTLHDSGPEQPMSFRAVLTNAKPPGEIHTTGSFGPWQRDEPHLTPVSGDYLFHDADLSVFPGISGTLSSTGRYHGVLDRIEVEGRTDTPDFALRVSRNRVHLTTQYQAVVDGTDGTTRLQPVTAHVGRSSIVARGIVESEAGVPGKLIRLDVKVREGGLEDLLRLGVKGKPPMNGVASLHTKFVLPPGNRDISERLQLDGGFDIVAARFAQAETQQRIDALSHRGMGHPRDTDGDPVASNFEGRFALHNGVMQFSDLAFDVPGVAISLKGTYGLEDGQLDFHGKARLVAKLSKTTTGFKSFLLKAADPFFAKNGAGAVLPVKILGTRESPEFGLDFRHKER